MALLKQFGILCTAISLWAGYPTQQAKAETLIEAQGVLATGDAILDDGSLYDKHVFTGRSGQQVTILLESQDFDPYLILLDPQGNRISENDDISHSNRNSQLRIVLPSAGDYVAIANSYEAGNSGSYSIQIDLDNYQSSSPAAVLATLPESTPLCNRSISNVIEGLGREHEIGVVVSALRLSTLYNEVIAARPVGLNMALSGPATASLLGSPQMLRTTAREVLSNCDTLGAVMFGSAEADTEKIFGYLPASAEQPAAEIDESAIGEFVCAEPDDEQFEQTAPQWGEQVCL